MENEQKNLTLSSFHSLIRFLKLPFWLYFVHCSPPPPPTNNNNNNYVRWCLAFRRFTQTHTHNIRILFYFFFCLRFEKRCFCHCFSLFLNFLRILIPTTDRCELLLFLLAFLILCLTCASFPRSALANKQCGCGERESVSEKEQRRRREKWKYKISSVSSTQQNVYTRFTNT